MISITKKTLISGNRIIAEIYVSDISELSGLDSVEGYELAHGSIAYVIKTGEFYVLDDDGKWYDTDSITDNEKTRRNTEIYVDDVSELPAADGKDFKKGSIAYVIKSGELYVMGSDGIWYNSDGGTPAKIPIVAKTQSVFESFKNPAETSGNPDSEGAAIITTDTEIQPSNI